MDAPQPDRHDDDVAAPVRSVSPAVLQRAAEVLRAMAYEHRLHILLLLSDGEATPSTLNAAVAAHPTAIAHHLRYLADTGLVRRRRRGRQVFYSLRDEAMGRLVDDVLNHVAEPVTRQAGPPGEGAGPR